LLVVKNCSLQVIDLQISLPNSFHIIICLPLPICPSSSHLLSMSIDRSIVSSLKLNSSLLAGVNLLVEVLIEGLHLLEIFKLQVQLVDVSILVSDSKVSFMNSIVSVSYCLLLPINLESEGIVLSSKLIFVFLGFLGSVDGGSCRFLECDLEMLSCNVVLSSENSGSALFLFHISNGMNLGGERKNHILKVIYFNFFLSELLN